MYANGIQLYNFFKESVSFYRVPVIQSKMMKAKYNDSFLFWEFMLNFINCRNLSMPECANSTLLTNMCSDSKIGADKSLNLTCNTVLDLYALLGLNAGWH